MLECLGKHSCMSSPLPMACWMVPSFFAKRDVLLAWRVACQKLTIIIINPISLFSILLRGIATAGKVGTSYGTSYFACPLYFLTYSLLSASLRLILCLISLFLLPQVLWTTLVDEFHNFYSNTEWNLLASLWNYSVKFGSGVWLNKSRNYFVPTSFHFHSFLLVFVQSCCSDAQVFRKTLLHEWHIFYSHSTHWNLLFSLSCDRLCFVCGVQLN